MAGFNGYNNPYNYNQPNYNPYMQEFQNMRDSIDRTMQRYQQQQQQNPMQQQPTIPQPQIHQSFQLAPQSSFSEIQAKYVSDINDVKNTFVMSLGMFLNKEMTTLWLKNINGEIRTFSLNEIIEQDPKDIEINNLKQELENMKSLISENKIKEEKIDMPKVSNKITKK